MKYIKYIIFAVIMLHFTTIYPLKGILDILGYGVVINPDPQKTPGGIVVVIRESPPDVSNGYKLGKEVCRVKTGTMFKAIKGIKIYNGEIWYNISIDNKEDIIFYKKKENELPPSIPFSAWMIGTFSNGTEVVRITKLKQVDNLHKQIEEGSDAELINPKESDISFFNKALEYLISFFSAICGFVYISVMREKIIKLKNIKKLFNQIFVTQALFIGIAIVFVTFSIISIAPTIEPIDSNYEITTNIMLLTKYVKTKLGYAIVSFILSVFFVRFTTIPKDKS
jgi:hypothetical protein